MNEWFDGRNVCAARGGGNVKLFPEFIITFSVQTAMKL